MQERHRSMDAERPVAAARVRGGFGLGDCEGDGVTLKALGDEEAGDAGVDDEDEGPWIWCRHFGCLSAGADLY